MTPDSQQKYSLKQKRESLLFRLKNLSNRFPAITASAIDNLMPKKQHYPPTKRFKPGAAYTQRK
ncbi:MAG: hypothetical protein ACFKPT_02075 [Gloeotrichia echinulata GP01]